MGIQRMLAAASAVVVLAAAGALVAPNANATVVSDASSRPQVAVATTAKKVDPNKVTPKAAATTKIVCEDGTGFTDWGNRGKKRDYLLTVCMQWSQREPGDERTKVWAVVAPTNRWAGSNRKVKLTFDETGDGKGVSTKCATGKKAKKGNSTICGTAKRGAAVVRISDDFVVGARIKVTARMLVDGKWIKATKTHSLLS